MPAAFAPAGPARGPFSFAAKWLPLVALALIALLPAPDSAAARQETRRSGAADASAGANTVEPYGRWERNLRRCRLELRGGSGDDNAGADPNFAIRRQGCRAVRLVQLERGLLSVRFVAEAAAPGAVAGQLAFAGLLEGGSRPMQCHQLRCRPLLPVRLRVSAVSLSGLMEAGNPSPLQQGRLARGSCELNARRLRCVALGSDGEKWIAEGQP